MREPIVTSHGTRSRRTIATLTWLGLFVAAALLWHGRATGRVSGHSSESVAMLLSAYAGFSSIFAWMLFSPNRRSAEQSSALFLSGGITLLPPCIIAFCLMPADSPLRGWVTLSVFLLILVAVMTPVPEELFAVPRDRSSYFRPVTGAMFSDVQLFDGLETADPFPSFTARQQAGNGGSALAAGILPATDAPATGTSATDLMAADSAATDSSAIVWQGGSGDPWKDPFRGTGIRPTRAGSGSGRRTSANAQSSVKKQLRSEHVADRAAHEPAARAVPPAPETFTLRPALRAHSDRRSATSEPAPARIPSQPHPTQRPAGAFGFQTPGTAGLDLPPVRQTDVASAAPNAASSAAPPVASNPAASLAPALDGGQLVSCERMRDEFGGEMIEGTVPVRFEPGQKRANVHVPFSPPLPGIPEVECESVGTDVLRLKVPVRQTYGIRIEARRSDATESLETEIGFAAVYTPPDRR